VSHIEWKQRVPNSHRSGLQTTIKNERRAWITQNRQFNGLQLPDDTPGEEGSAGGINWILKTQIACVEMQKNNVFWQSGNFLPPFFLAGLYH